MERDLGIWKEENNMTKIYCMKIFKNTFFKNRKTSLISTICLFFFLIIYIQCYKCRNFTFSVNNNPISPIYQRVSIKMAQDASGFECCCNLNVKSSHS